MTGTLCTHHPRKLRRQVASWVTLEEVVKVANGILMRTQRLCQEYMRCLLTFVTPGHIVLNRSDLKVRGVVECG